MADNSQNFEAFFIAMAEKETKPRGRPPGAKNMPKDLAPTKITTEITFKETVEFEVVNKRMKHMSLKKK
jgi:hypothetical protein